MNKSGKKVKKYQMRRALVPPLSQLDLAHPVRVERVTLVRVDHNDEES